MNHIARNKKNLSLIITCFTFTAYSMDREPSVKIPSLQELTRQKISKEIFSTQRNNQISKKIIQKLKQCSKHPAIEPLISKLDEPHLTLRLEGIYSTATNQMFTRYTKEGHIATANNSANTLTVYDKNSGEVKTFGSFFSPFLYNRPFSGRSNPMYAVNADFTVGVQQDTLSDPRNLSCCGDGNLRFVRLRNRNILQTIDLQKYLSIQENRPMPYLKIKGVALSKQNNFVGINVYPGCIDEWKGFFTLCIYDCKNQSLSSVPERIGADCHPVFTDDEKTIYAWHPENKLIQWDIYTKEKLAQISIPLTEVSRKLSIKSSFAINNQNNMLSAVFNHTKNNQYGYAIDEECLYIFDCNKKESKLIKDIGQCDGHFLSSPRFSNDDTLLFIVSREVMGKDFYDQIQCIDANNLVKISTIPMRHDFIANHYNLEVSPEDNTVLTFFQKENGRYACEKYFEYGLLELWPRIDQLSFEQKLFLFQIIKYQENKTNDKQLYQDRANLLNDSILETFKPKLFQERLIELIKSHKPKPRTWLGKLLHKKKKQ